MSSLDEIEIFAKSSDIHITIPIISSLTYMIDLLHTIHSRGNSFFISGFYELY